MVLHISRNGHTGHFCRSGLSDGCTECSFGCMSYSGWEIIDWFVIGWVGPSCDTAAQVHSMGLLVKFGIL